MFWAAKLALHVLDHLPQLGHLLPGDLRGKKPSDHFVETATDDVELSSFLDTQLAHERASILAQVDETGLLKATKGFSNGAAADAQNAGQFLFSQLRSRRVRPVQNESQDLVAHDAGERFRLEYLQLRCGDGHVTPRFNRRYTCVVEC